MEIREIALFASAICLILFAVIGMIDGLYLHLWRFELHAHAESKFEHKVHAIRAVLFPLMLTTAFAPEASGVMLWLGAALALIDLAVLGVDALNEGDSRAFMGGLPTWEYLIHLFANGFHFAATALALAARPLAMWSIGYAGGAMPGIGMSFLTFVSSNVLPGAMLLAVLHLGLMHPAIARYWGGLKRRVACC